MSQNVEDILSGDNPEKDLKKMPQGNGKDIGYRIMHTLRKAPQRPMNAYSREQLWRRIAQTTSQDEVSTPTRTFAIRIAKWSAAACLLILASYLVWETAFKQPSVSPLIHAAMNNKYTFEEDNDISLHGENQHLLVDSAQSVIDISSLGDDSSVEDIGSFITLTVPYGKRMEVILPDNSNVWVNAGSQLTFPRKFDDDKREVYLEGEAFFDIISQDREVPFFVETSDMRINVLGTTFNVSSYPDDAFSSAVLLSGTIELQGTPIMPFETRVLEPGNAAILNRESRVLHIRNEKAEDHMSWTNKQLILKNDPLPEILVRLGRVYNTKITVEDEAVKGDTFSGRLDLTQPLPQLLLSLYSSNEYTIEEEERRILVKRR